MPCHRCRRPFLVGLTVLILVFGPEAHVVSAQPTGGMATVAPSAPLTYYVDCGASGLDSHPGTSTALPWRTVTRANAAPLHPGDQLLFRRGCVWNAQRLEAQWTGTSTAPVRISAYGTGALPLIKNGLNQNVRITGSWQVLDSLAVRFDATQFTTCGEPIGDHYGFNFQAGAHDNTIQYSSASYEMAGIHLAAGATHNHIVHNEIHHNQMLTAFNSNPEVDQGAWGILVNGAYNGIAYNYFHDNAAVCRNQGWVLRSKSINVYAAVGNLIHHNMSSDRVFAELGSAPTIRTAHNVFAYNVFASTMTDSRFVTTRGAGDTAWGPVLGTILLHNTTYQTGTGSWGISCSLGCDGTVLTTESNVVWAEHGLWADLPFPDHGDVYWNSAGAPIVNAPDLDPSTLLADPRFVDAAAGNFRVTTGSPAVDAGSSAGAWSADFYGVALPQGAAVDRGAAEFVPTTPTAPTIGLAAAGDQSATVSWTVPASDGGSPITGYAVTAYVGFSPAKTATFLSTATTEVVGGLLNGTIYRFRVQAINALGIGSYSTASNPVTPAPS
jgi:hypothetical protein